MIRRKQIKQIAGCVMAVTMALTGVPVTAGTENINVEVVYADETLTYTEGNSTYTYKILEDGTLCITDYVGTDVKVTIPDEINGKKVTEIGDNTFSFCSSLISIEIPESVTSIDDFAFYECSSLEKIVIPEGVTSIGDYAFEFCSSLTRVEIPESVTSIGSSAFSICSSLISIEIPESVTSIDDFAFYGCSSLTSIEMPKGVTSIGSSAFSECSSLTRVEIPESVTSIGSSAFSFCSSLTSIEILEGVTSIGFSVFDGCSSLEEIEVDADNLNYKSVEGVLFDKELTKIICYPSGKKDAVYIVPEGVTSIGDYAFSNCRSLTRVEIPEGVTSIGWSAFWSCSSLTSVEIPEGVTNIGRSAFGCCSSLTSVEIPEGVTSIGDYAFSNCSSLTSVEIPEGVTSIGWSAFEDCSSLTRVEIPEGVTSIDWSAFEGCSSLTRVEILESVTSIGNGAFRLCSSLEEIEVDINNLNYKSVEGVLFNKEMTEIIYYPPGKKDLVYIIPDSVTSIGWSAFEGCSSLKEIMIPEGVTYIDCDAFYNCPNLTIYAKKDSYAETHANVYDIPFIAIDKITSLDNITVTYPSESIQGTVSLETRKLTEADEEYNKINFEDKIIDSSVAVEDVAFTAYDISLVDENNNKVQLSQVVTVKIPCPEGYDGEKCNIYRVNDDGTFTDMKAEYENGYFVFETSHFSIYVITETELVADEEEIITVIKGDVNGDGTLDIKDSALLKRYLAGWEVEIDEEAADVDDDGKVTIKDSALVKRYLAGWDVEFVAD